MPARSRIFPLWEDPKILTTTPITDQIVVGDISVGLGHESVDNRPNQQFVVLSNAKRFSSNPDWLFEWLARKLQFDPESGFDQQRAFFRGLISAFFLGGESCAAWCVLQTKRIPIRDRLKYVFQQKALRSPIALCAGSDYRDARFDFFGLEFDAKELLMISRENESTNSPQLTSVDIQRAITTDNVIHGQERWYCLAKLGAEQQELADGRIPANDAYRLPGKSVNLVPIFSLVRCDKDGMLTRVSAEVNPYSGYTFDMRAARVPLEMSLRMDPKEHELLWRALRPSEFKPRRGFETRDGSWFPLNFESLAIESATPQRKRLAQQLEAFYGFAQSGESLRQAALDLGYVYSSSKTWAHQSIRRLIDRLSRDLKLKLIETITDKNHRKITRLTDDGNLLADWLTLHPHLIGRAAWLGRNRR